MSWAERPRWQRWTIYVLAAFIALAALGTIFEDDESTVEASSSTTAIDEPNSVQATSHGVPDVVGLDLQTAQDSLQAAGYKHIESVDDTGRGRNQVIDSNWVVVSQTPAAGDDASTAYEIVLFVVKEGER